MYNFSKNKNYYEILNVKKTATLEEIISAKNKLKFEEGKLFDKEVDEAYEVLSNPKTREIYDSLNSFEEKNNNSFIYNVSKYTDELNEMEAILLNSKREQQEEINYNLNKLSEVNSNIDFNKGIKIVLGSYLGFSVLGPLGAIGAGVIVHELVNNPKIQKEIINKRISKISTPEYALNKLYRKNLSVQTEKLLNKSDNKMNHSLELQKLTYENQIILIKQIIDSKRNQKDKAGYSLINKLKVKELEFELDAYQKEIEKINLKIANNLKTDKLNLINENLENVNNLINEQENKNRTNSILIKGLKIYKKATELDKLIYSEKMKITNNVNSVIKKGSIIISSSVKNAIEFMNSAIEYSDANKKSL